MMALLQARRMLRASVEQAPDGTYYLTLKARSWEKPRESTSLAMKTVAFYVASNLGLLRSDGTTNFMSTSSDALVTLTAKITFPQSTVLLRQGR